MPSGAGRFAAASWSAVPAAIMASSRTGRAKPCSQMFWPSSEYRNSCHSRAAAGCGASLLIACT